MRYDGGKNGDGVYQAIINQMPPHTHYIELFLGSGAIMRRKKPALVNVGVEIDRETFSAVKTVVTASADQNFKWKPFNCDALEWLKPLCEGTSTKDVLIYADPPYLMSVRSCQRDLYRHEFHTVEQHTRLLELAKSIPCRWMISGYRSALYDDLLRDWRRVDFQAMTRRGLVTESLWCNFPEPVELHDYGFLGRDNTDRQRILRKKTRWKNRLAKMSALERQAVLSAILELTQDAQTETTTGSRA